MLTGNSMARQGMLQKAVTDAAMLGQRDRALQEESTYHQGLIDTALGRDRSLNQQRQVQNEFERRRVELQEALGVASFNKDVLGQTKLIKEITELDRVAAAYDRASQTNDGSSLSMADWSRIGMTPPKDERGLKPDLFMDDEGNLRKLPADAEVPKGWRKPLNEVQQQMMDLRVADAIARIEENPNSFSTAGDVATVNAWSADPVFYIQAEDPDVFDFFPGSKLNAKLIKVPLPPGMTAAGITQTAAANRISPIQVLMDAGVDFSKYGLTAK